MKHLIWLLLLLSPSLQAQELRSDTCVDLLYEKGGSVFRGTIVEYKQGAFVSLRIRNGQVLYFPQNRIRKIVQHCPEPRRDRTGASPKMYNFSEKGWYHATRLGFLPGQSDWGENVTGLFLHHSSGYALRRQLGIGLGAGVDMFTPGYNDVATYPVFAEIRGYLLARRLTPFYALSAGWAFAGNQQNTNNGRVEDWQGGWMFNGMIGYRMGNHFTMHAGVHLQRKLRDWESVWDNSFGTDRILNKRLQIGFGIIL